VLHMNSAGQRLAQVHALSQELVSQGALGALDCCTSAGVDLAAQLLISQLNNIPACVIPSAHLVLAGERTLGALGCFSVTYLKCDIRKHTQHLAAC
jgi:hypothetical protein